MKCIEADQDFHKFSNDNFYVDGLVSLDSADGAVNLPKKTQKVLWKMEMYGSIRLSLTALKKDDLSKKLKLLDLDKDVLPVNNSLAIMEGFVT